VRRCGLHAGRIDQVCILWRQIAACCFFETSEIICLAAKSSIASRPLKPRPIFSGALHALHYVLSSLFRHSSRTGHRELGTLKSGVSMFFSQGLLPLPCCILPSVYPNHQLGSPRILAQSRKYHIAVSTLARWTTGFFERR